MKTTRLRPHPYLLRRGVAAVLAFFVPVFGALYFLDVPRGPWLVVVITQLVVMVIIGWSMIAYARLGIWVDADSITERGFGGLKKKIGASEIGSLVIASTFRGGWTQTVPQLFVCAPDGRQMMRMRGQFWSRESMSVVANTLDVTINEVSEPVTTAELRARYPGLLYWFERRPVLAASLFAAALIAGAALVYVSILVLGHTGPAGR